MRKADFDQIEMLILFVQGIRRLKSIDEAKERAKKSGSQTKVLF